jgi:hypothetical protein
LGGIFNHSSGGKLRNTTLSKYEEVNIASKHPGEWGIKKSGRRSEFKYDIFGIL